ncbi:hypothetical protein H6P81_015099 [Aristolochia fimbriata]|uniref:RRM domain-containing protein n=1 Tax=Aristolochia fimbriata TaxID=158543 RepID=A0AAV7E5A9_ARIFI|nr:hypothetical protein H6P81_015099 [Aristolochia fimbriata]
MRGFPVVVPKIEREKMSYSRRSRYSYSPLSYRDSRSRSRSMSRSRSRSRSGESVDVENPGNNLYVTGLSPRITKKDLEKHFSSEGTVSDVHLVVDPWTRESRGFGFVTMETVKEADRCIKYLNRSVLEGRVITVEKAKRRRGRTPTPGRYLGVKTIRVRRRSPSNSPYSRSRDSSPRYSSESDGYESPCYYRRRGRSISRSRSRSRYSRSQRRRTGYYSRSRSRSRSFSRYSRSPYYRRRDRSYSPYHYSRSYHYYRSPSPYYRSRRYRSPSRGLTPRGRSYSTRVSTRSPPRCSSVRRSRGSSSSSSYSPSPSRSYSRSISPSRSASLSR